MTHVADTPDKPPILDLLQIDVTDECPLCCGHCSNSSGPLERSHFPIEQLEQIVDEASQMGLKSIVYSGGEPLRYPHIERAIALASRAGIYSSIFTTGIQDMEHRIPISESRWRDLKAAGLDCARFSVYAGPSKRRFHNMVVRIKPSRGDAFEVNETAVRMARDAGLHTEIHFVPSNESASELFDIYDWAKALGCDCLHLQVPTLQGRNATHCVLSLTLSAERELMSRALKLSKNAGATKFYVSRFWRDRWAESSDSLQGPALNQVIIRSDGTVSANNACKYLVPITIAPNVLRRGETLSQIWHNSALLSEVRGGYKENRIPIYCEDALAVSEKRLATKAGTY